MFRARSILLALTVWLGCSGVAARESDAPLRPQEVLAASLQHFPRILEAMARRRGMAASLLEAEGAFDLVFEADGHGRATGFYEGTALGGGFRQPLRDFGGSLYGGYAISRGDFPIYEDAHYTSLGASSRPASSSRCCGTGSSTGADTTSPTPGWRPARRISNCLPRRWACSSVRW